MTVRVLLADDHALVRTGLRRLVDSQTDFEVVGEATDGQSAIELGIELEPHVILMDVAMPDTDGLEATRQLTLQAPDVRVIALSGHAEKRLVAGMLAAGARGYVIKDADADELFLAIRRVAAGGTFLCSGAADVVVTDYVKHVLQPSQSELSSRETQVLRLLAEGHTTKDIAAQLHVSIKTVESHRARIMEKLSLRTVAQLTKYAIRQGLTTVDE